MTEGCYFRKPNQYFDYHLWQGKRSCSKKIKSCKPKIPKIKSKDEIIAHDKSIPQTETKRLPHNVEVLKKMLQKAIKNGSLIIGKGNIYNSLQGDIDASGSRDFHLLFGNAHLVEQDAFINELISSGSDSKILKGITHLSLELGRRDDDGEDLQYLKVDPYLIDGKNPVDINPIDGKVNAETEKSDAVDEKSFQIAYQYCYNISLSGINLSNVRNTFEGYGEYYSYKHREDFAVNSTYQRMHPKRRDVVVWPWGGTHTEKNALPRYLLNKDPKAKVVSILLNGGQFVEAFALDHAIRDVGVQKKYFIWKLDPSVRDADYIVHIPVGEKINKSYSTSWDPVGGHIVDPPVESTL